MASHEDIKPSALGGPHTTLRFVFADASAKTALNDTNKGTLTLTAEVVALLEG